VQERVAQHAPHVMVCAKRQTCILHHLRFRAPRLAIAPPPLDVDVPVCTSESSTSAGAGSPERAAAGGGVLQQLLHLRDHARPTQPRDGSPRRPRPPARPGCASYNAGYCLGYQCSSWLVPFSALGILPRLPVRARVLEDLLATMFIVHPGGNALPALFTTPGLGHAAGLVHTNLRWLLITVADAMALCRGRRGRGGEAGGQVWRLLHLEA